MDILGYVFMIIGGVFYALGGFGVFRMPDVLNRIQAGTKATTLGTFSLLIGIGFMNPSWFLKIALLIVFIAITNPVGSSVLARGAYNSEDEKKDLVVDQLKEKDGADNDN